MAALSPVARAATMALDKTRIVASGVENRVAITTSKSASANCSHALSWLRNSGELASAKDRAAPSSPVLASKRAFCSRHIAIPGSKPFARNSASASAIAICIDALSRMNRNATARCRCAHARSTLPGAEQSAMRWAIAPMALGSRKRASQASRCRPWKSDGPTDAELEFIGVQLCDALQSTRLAVWTGGRFAACD